MCSRELSKNDYEPSIRADAALPCLACLLVVVYGLDDRREETFFDLHPLLMRLQLLGDERET